MSLVEWRVYWLGIKSLPINKALTREGMKQYVCKLEIGMYEDIEES